MAAVLAFFVGPYGRWIVVLALIVSAGAAGEIHGRIAEAERGTLAAKAQHDADVKQAASAAAMLQSALDKAKTAAALVIAGLEKNLKDEKAKHEAALAKVKKEADDYVADKTSGVCGSVTYGYLVFRSRVSDIANGRDPTATVPSRELADAAAGVSLRDLAEGVDTEQAGAYSTCRERDAAWQKHVDVLEGYVKDIFQRIGQH